MPSRMPESISWRLTHVSSVCGTQPSSEAIDSTANHNDGYSPRCSCTKRTARSRMAAPRVVDTSAWIEWLTASALGQKLGKLLPGKAQCIVPTIVQLELSKRLVREAGEKVADQVIVFTQKCVVVPLDTPIALLAADLRRQHKLATADAIGYATARHAGADLLTCDAHFEGFPVVRLYPKTV